MGLYAKKGDMKNFLIAKDKYFTYSDSFMNQRSFLQVKNDWKHIEQPTSKTSKKNNYFWLWICVVVFMITPLWVIYNKKSERKKIKKSTVRKITERSSAQKDDMRQAILQIFNDKETICNPDFTLNTMATLLHSNTSYVSAYVSAYINDNFNKNFRTLLNQYRIEYGKRILADETTYGNITIQAIAQMLGYKSATTFVSAFKTLTGMTPSTWKKQQSDNNLS